MRAQVAVGEAPARTGGTRPAARAAPSPRVAEARARRPRAAVTDGDRVADLLEYLGGGDRVVAEALSGESSLVGGEADLPQCGRFLSRLPMAKSRVSLIVVSVRIALSSLWYCLILLCL